VQYVVFSLDDRRYGVRVDDVAEVALRVAFTPLAGAPLPVVGLFSCRGEPAVAVDLRERLGRPPPRPAMSDRIVVVRSSRRLLGLVVDAVEGLVEAEALAPPVAATHLSGVVAGPDGLWLVQDVGSLLSLEEEIALTGLTD
jgi:purine-binding chemotaxis protein CheW